MKPDAVAIAAQTHAANAIRRRLGKPPCDFELREVPVSHIKPPQFGEDYDNASSRELARKTAGGQASDRKQDNWPIAVDEAGTIIDGNHRHAAAVMNGRKTIWALVAKRRS
jgi:hypothetical protein